MLERLLSIWSRIETVLIGTLVLCALFTFMGGAALRVLAPQHAVDWADEVALYFIVWATALGGSVLAAEGRHINTEILVTGLPPHLRRAAVLFTGALTLAFCAAMFWFGWEAFEFSKMLDDRSASSLRTPQAWTLFLALPVGMGLMALRIVLLAIVGRGITTAAEALPGKVE
ncbi:TRAP transporter small permease [Pararhodobacter zhoushanensis]|uniref:TRAP transporter small permease protein n=1 Tax=Pararhodobacter zhoushanensis TaxID=2479545 RepID=A0ABT3GZ84_9RHOB|nr:TRAP transporter small permease [Pararhodobacter zhoushanensis]MCW1932870.1 TRAP transporter small permease [Pararhodobacter zhoushanensis]